MKDKEKPKIIFVVTEDWYFCSHRLPIARAARDAGFEVLVATHVGQHAEAILQEGFRLVSLSFSRKTKSIWREIFSIAELFRLYRREGPSLVHHIALKPIVYGSFASFFIPSLCVVNTFAGLGYFFTSSERKARLVGPLIKRALQLLLAGPHALTIAQNPDDQKKLAAMVPSCRIRLVRGSGINTTAFYPKEEPDGEITIALVARMLRDKGVRELVDAAQILKELGEKCQIWLVGPVDPDNPSFITDLELQRWTQQDSIKWLGHRKNILSIWHSCHIAVLPSYGEGLPKSLLEAAACGKPIITTDVPGCREVVRHGINGLLVSPRNATALAFAIRELLHDQPRRLRMGRASREFACQEFSDKTVADNTMAVYRELLAA